MNRSTIRASSTLVAALALLVFAGCAGTQAPTPVASDLQSLLPSSAVSAGVEAICDASSELSGDIEAIRTAAESAAAGGDFDLPEAETRIDAVIAALNGLSAAADAATARDEAVSALQQLRAEVADPSPETAQAVVDALDGIDSVRTAVCG